MEIKKEKIGTPIKFLIVAIIIISFGLVIFVNVFEVSQTMDTTAFSDSQNILSDNGTSTTLDPVGAGVTSSSFTRLNQTWLDFDGEDDYVEIDNIPYSNDYSYSVWFKPLISNQSDKEVFVSRNNGNKGIIRLTSDGTIDVFYNSSTGGFTSKSTSSLYSKDNLYNIFVTKKENNLTIYMDGVYQNGANNPGDWTAGRFFLASSDGGASANSNISLYSFNFYDRYLTPKEVSDLYSLNTIYYNLSDNFDFIYTNLNYTNIYLNSSGFGFGYYSNKMYEDNSTTKDFSDSKSIYSFTEGSNTEMVYVDSRETIFADRRGTGKLYYSTGNSTNWTSTSSFLVCNQTGIDSNIWSMTEDNDTNLYVGEYSFGDTTEKCAYIYKSINGGIDWSVVYNDSDSNNITSNFGGRHIHKVKFNEYNNCSYASVGDFLNVSKIIKSCNGGGNWSIIRNDTKSNILGMEFTPNYRIFGEDEASSTVTSNIYRTSDDTNYENVLNLTLGVENCNFWRSTKDNNGRVYFITACLANNYSGVYVSGNEGNSWNRIGYIRNVGDSKGYKRISNTYLNNAPYLFYSDTSENSYLLNLSMIDNTYNYIKLNENSGLTAHDTSGNGNDGIILGATWNNDAITVALTNIVDYTISGATFTLVNSVYAWDQIVGSYDYYSVSGSSSTTVLRLVGIFIVLAIIIFLLIPFKLFSERFSK